MKKTVKISQNEVDLLEGQQIELANITDLYAYSISDDCPYHISEDRINSLENKRLSIQKNHTVTMQAIAKEHIPDEFINKMYNFNIDFSSKTITYTEV